MQNLIDAKMLLRVFSLTEQLGQAVTTPVGAGYELQGLQVATGFDGYDLYFFAAGVTLTLGFIKSILSMRKLSSRSSSLFNCCNRSSGLALERVFQRRSRSL